ncbi:MAG: tetratricopeptide repeat protein [Candidatus Omnitrophica bacterium]|nr:tetratricopeptide repeat protein [Candidatus Omnitrophota bacterium]MDD5518062.1 tetratricopeptide repeat protein [Candidatus Omnitrophota bacterium]
MPSKTLKKNLKRITLIVNCFLFIFTAHLLAADKVIKKKKEELTSLQKQAQLYRNEGLKSQNLGDLETALKLYQKAAGIDPEYAVVHNDLGVIYESQGDLERAEESYLRAIEIDPSYESAYSNLALLYEDRRDLQKAAYFWKKRVELGNPNDLWTWKAEKRLKDINLILFGKSAIPVQEKDVNTLMQDVIAEKTTLGQSSKQAAVKKPQNIKLESFEKSYSKEMQKALEDARKLNSKKKGT